MDAGHLAFLEGKISGDIQEAVQGDQGVIEFNLNRLAVLAVQIHDEIRAAQRQ